MWAITPLLVAVPTYFYLRALRSLDRFEREPARYVFAAFSWGAVPAVLLAVVAQLILGLPVEAVFGGESLGARLVESSVFAPLTEEILKAVAVALIFLLRRREFDGWVDGIVYGAAAGFGFAYVENVFYLVGTASWGEWLTLFFLRVLVFGFMHGFWTSLVGIGFGIARHSKRSSTATAAIVLGMLGLAMASHFVHNAAITLVEESGGATLLVALANYGLVGLLFIGLSLLSLQHDRRMFRVYLADEVPARLSDEDYAALTGIGLNAGARLRLLSRRRRSLVQAAAELAQRKYQFVRHGNADGAGADIPALRDQLARLSAEARG